MTHRIRWSGRRFAWGIPEVAIHVDVIRRGSRVDEEIVATEPLVEAEGRLMATKIEEPIKSLFDGSDILAL